MNDPLPRWLIVLTLIVAVIAISVGIKDYFGQKQPTTAANTTQTEAGDRSKTKSRPKRLTSAKNGRAGTSLARTKNHATTQAAGDDAEEPLVSKEFTSPGADRILVIGARRNDGTPKTSVGQLEAALDGKDRVHGQLGEASGSSSCLPLPNLTKPGDVDARYYENWAREYCGGTSFHDVDPNH